MNSPASVEKTPQLPFLERNHVWAIAACALLLRLAVLFFILFQFGDTGFILPPFSDGHGYVTIAQNVLAGNGFSLDEQAPFHSDTKRVPLYPLFLSLTFALSGGAFWLAALFQVFMGAAVAFVLYKVTDALAGRRAAFFAGAIAAVYPFSVFLSTQLLAETLFVLVLFGAFSFFLRSPASPTYRSIAIAGVLMGLATLVKPAAQYIPFLLLPFIALRQRGLQRFAQPAVFVICFLLVISPWVARNHYTSGKATLSHEANILLDLHYAGYMAYTKTGAAGRADEYRTATSTETMNAISRGEFIRRILVVMATDPIGFAKYLSISTVPFVFGDGFVTMVSALSPSQAIPAWNFSTSGSALGRTLGFGALSPTLLFFSLASKALWGLVLICATFGFIRLLRYRGDKMFMALGIGLVTAYFMFAGGPVQSARYRAPVEPLIFLLAGIGAAEFMRLYAIHSRRRDTLPSGSN